MAELAEEDAGFLTAAGALGAALCRDALWWKGRCTWLGDRRREEDGRVAHGTLGPDLYAGAAGVALFLARLYAVTGERLVARTARGAAAQALAQADRLAGPARHGFYTGRCGIAWSAVTVGEALGEEGWSERGLSLLGSLAREVAGGTSPVVPDLMSGHAGAIGAALALFRRRRDGWLLDWAAVLGEGLLRAADRSGPGWSWTSLLGRPPLTGLSHGAAGIAWALAELHRETGDPRFREAALEGVRYERRWYLDDEENWADLREGQTQAGLAWCHGAPGICLSRLRLHEILGEPGLLAEAEAALRTTARSLAGRGDGQGFSLCHGQAGNAEILASAGREMNRPDLLARARSVGRQGLRRYQDRHAAWPCGVQGGGTTPSLMLGLAGIGHFYLRLHDLEQIPSILLPGEL
ncbi:MAG TPA: lanthionine synthetase LanC family protein [Thermoanaerobaculia bacterium]|nr:lanthionine synthetase LanC family protein [Thermoanaerobaculia bacterium]